VIVLLSKLKGEVTYKLGIWLCSEALSGVCEV